MKFDLKKLSIYIFYNFNAWKVDKILDETNDIAKT